MEDTTLDLNYNETREHQYMISLYTHVQESHDYIHIIYKYAQLHMNTSSNVHMHEYGIVYNDTIYAAYQALSQPPILWTDKT